MNKFSINFICLLFFVNSIYISAYSQDINPVSSNCEEFIQDRKNLLELSICLSLESDYFEAIEILNKIITENPSDINTYYQRGLIYYKLSLLTEVNSEEQLDQQPQYEQKAIEDFNQILLLNPNFAKAYYYIAVINTQYCNSNYIENLDRAIELKYDFADAYYQRSNFYHICSFVVEPSRNSDYLQKALIDLNQAIHFQPNFAEAYYLRGSWIDGESSLLELTAEHLESTEAIQILEDYTNAIRINPNFYEELQGDNLPLFENLDLENQEYIIKYLTLKIQNDPQNPELYYSRGYYYLKLGQLSEAIADFSKVIQLNAQDAEAYYKRGFALYRLKDYQGAINDFTEALRLNPKFTKAFLSRSLTYYDLGNMSEAIKDASKMIELNPVPDIRTRPIELNPYPLTVNAYFIRGRAYQNLGDLNQAVKDYEIAFTYWPYVDGPAGGSSLQGDPERLYALGRFLAARGAKKEAITHLQQAASLFQAQGNNDGYQQAQSLMKRLQN